MVKLWSIIVVACLAVSSFGLEEKQSNQQKEEIAQEANQEFKEAAADTNPAQQGNTFSGSQFIYQNQPGCQAADGTIGKCAGAATPYGQFAGQGPFGQFSASPISGYGYRRQRYFQQGYQGQPGMPYQYQQMPQGQYFDGQQQQQQQQDQMYSQQQQQQQQQQQDGSSQFQYEQPILQFTQTQRSQPFYNPNMGFPQMANYPGMSNQAFGSPYINQQQFAGNLGCNTCGGDRAIWPYGSTFNQYAPGRIDSPLW